MLIVILNILPFAIFSFSQVPAYYTRQDHLNLFPLYTSLLKFKPWVFVAHTTASPNSLAPSFPYLISSFILQPRGSSQDTNSIPY